MRPVSIYGRIVDMTLLINGTLRWLALAVAVITLSACHIAGHVPPGQAKQVLYPNPGHGGTPPGQENR